MAKPVPSRRRKALAPATVDVIDGLAALTDAVQKARSDYRAEFLNKRPPNAFTMREFATQFNSTAKDICAPISHRAAEAWFQKWVQAGEYQRAPMMLPGSDGIPRRTYVYWKTK